jgi:tetratricopeptide (TPR) repeat protein
MLLVGLTVLTNEGMARVRKDKAPTIADALYNSLYLESVCQREAGHLAAQYELLNQALKLNPNAPEAVFDMAACVSQGNVMDEETVTELFDKAVKLTKGKNPYYLETYAEYLTYRQMFERAVPLWEKLTNDENKRENAYRMLVTCYDRLGRNEDMLHVLETWTKVEGGSEYVEVMRMKTLNRLGRYNEAITIADKLAEENPSNEYYAAARAESLLESGDTAQAGQEARKLKEKYPQSPSVQVLLIHYLNETKQRDQMLKAVADVILNDDQEMGLRTSMMQSLMSDVRSPEEEKQVVQVFDSLMTQPLEDASLPELYIHYLVSKHAPDSAYMPAMRRMIDIDPSDNSARLMMVQDALNRKDYGETITQCREGIRYNPKNLIYYHIGGGALYQEKRYEESLVLFKQGLPFVKDTKELETVSNFYSSYADALHETGHRDEAYALYDSALVYNPVNTVALNNYAYFLSLDGIRLDYAREMSSKVLEIEPNNPTYIDTYAWILFLNKDYNEALSYIDKALEKVNDEPGDGSLYEHAGDIYYHLDKRTEALRFWRKAETLGGGSEMLSKKIKNQRYYEQ